MSANESKTENILKESSISNSQISFKEQKSECYIKEIKQRNNDIAACIEYCMNYDFTFYNEIKEKIQSGMINKIVMAGMGSSLYACEQAQSMIEQQIFTLYLEASELERYYSSKVDSKTLLIVVSQSGNSKEVIDLLKVVNDDQYMITITNNTSGELYKRYKNSLLINASEEFYIAHNSYLNTLIVLQNLFEYLFDYKNKGIDSVDKFIDQLNDFDKLMESKKDDIMKKIKHVQSIDCLYDFPSRGNARNSALLFREGLGIMSAFYSKDEYLHGEHLVEIQNKLTCLLGVNINDSNVESILQNDIEFKNTSLIITSEDIDYDGITIIKTPKEIELYCQIIAINQIVLWSLKGE